MNDIFFQTFQRIIQGLRRAGCMALGCMLLAVLTICIVLSVLGVAAWSALSNR